MTALTLVFDLDGTLVDTASDLLRACDHALALVGLGPAPVTVTRPKISFGSRAMILAGLEAHGVALTDAEVDALWRAFLTFYEADIAATSRPFAGVEELLAREHARGTRLAVCTNKVERMAQLLLDRLDMSRYFGAIAGRDTFAVMKPHPGHLIETIAAAGGVARNAVMIGDSDVDIATAKAAHIPVIAVTFGYTPAPVASFAPDAVIDSYGEFDAALARVRPR